MAVLEVRFHPVGDVTTVQPTLLRRLDEFLQPAANAAAPGAPHRAGHRGEQLLVAGDQPGIQQPERGTQIGGRRLHGLTDGAHAVIKLDAGVP